MFQYQCPNCGGYKTQHTRSRPQTPLPPASVLHQLENLMTVAIGLGILSATLAIGGYVAGYNYVQSYGDCGRSTTCDARAWFLEVSVIGVPWLIALVALVATVKTARRRTQLREAAELEAPPVESAHFFTCDLCGYSWTWKGIASPPMTFGTPRNPDAARLGAMRLAELEEKKRRAAAGDAYQRQLRGEL